MTAYRIRFTGPASLAMRVATALADADGVELVASEPPAVLDQDTVALHVAAEGAYDDVADAVASVRDGLPSDATLEFVDG